jgi:hypothetical protein
VLLGRRPFLINVAAVTASSTPLTAGSISAASPLEDKTDDPFAQIDSMISDQVSKKSIGGIDSSSSAAGGGGPYDSQNTVGDKQGEQATAMKPAASSDMAEALKSAQKRRQIDPRSHG